MFFCFFSMWHLEKHKKRWTRKTKQQKVKPLQAPRTKQKWAQQRRLWQHKVKKMHVWSWLANHQLIQHPRKTLQSQHLHETWRQLSCNRFLALLHDAIMSHCELWVDLNLRMGDCFLHSHVITWTLFLAQRETVVDLTGPGWVVGIWLNDKRRKDLYIYIYICRERERERGQESVGKGEEEAGRSGGVRTVGGRESWVKGEEGQEEVKTKSKGKIFIQHQTTASI